MNEKTRYGQLELIDHQIIRTIDGEIKFKIPVQDIKVIGEFTTIDGLYLDDWFLTILTAEDWFEIPMYVEDIETFFSDLRKELNSQLSHELAYSTTCKTRIIYPDIYKNKELYKIVSKGSGAFLNKMKKNLDIESTVRQFSETTNEILNSNQ